MENNEEQKKEVVETVDQNDEKHQELVEKFVSHEEHLEVEEHVDVAKENKEVVEKVNPNNEVIQEIMEKVITDPEFKKKLLESPDEVLNPYPLSEITKIMIKSLTEEDYNNLTPENITEYFEADSAIYTPDFDDSIPIEYVDEDDI